MTNNKPFHLFSRILHWIMAAMILAMLFIGIGMIASVTHYHWLLSIHKPLGILILLLAFIRLINYIFNRPPNLPKDMPLWQKIMAHGSHILLYALMIAIPLIGWGMLSAGNYPITLYGALHLPSILPQNPMLYADLRLLHKILAFCLFGIIIAHIAAALMHALIFRDGVFQSMASFKTKKN